MQGSRQDEDGDLDTLFEVEMNAHRLAEEWERQARSYYRYAAELADARNEYDRRKAALDVVVAELDKEIRASPEDFGVTAKRLTEAIIDRTIVLQVRHLQAVSRMLDAKHRMDSVQAVVGALDHKKRSLESGVTLLGRALYAEPVARGADAAAVAAEECREVFGRRRDP